MSENEQIKRVKDARVWLSARVPFLGYMTTRLRPRIAEPHDGVPTAGVARDGTLVLNEQFVAGLTDPQVRGLIAHEVLHPALGVFERLGSRQMRLWNIAHDYVINAIIVDFAATVGGSLELPPGGLLDRQFDHLSAEEVYDKLLEAASEGFVFTVPGTGSDLRDDLAETERGRDAAHGDQSAGRSLDNDWKTTAEAARQTHEAQLGQGSLPGRLQAILDEIKDPKVAWQTVLSQWLGENGCKSDLTYQRPSRRSESVGEILPGVLKTGLPDVTILWDTSGSMNGLATDILSEVAAITTELGLTVRLMICDTMVHADVEGLDNPESFIPHITGGGGSDFTPAFDVLSGEGNTSVVVAFTDGYIGVPGVQPASLGGVLWCLTQGGVRPAPWGQAIKMTADGFAEDM